jgi:hypothetical protein
MQGLLNQYQSALPKLTPDGVLVKGLGVVFLSSEPGSRCG